MANLATRLGEYKITNDKIDGTISNPRVCAVTGKPVQPGDARINISGSPYFYFIKAPLNRTFTPARRDELETALFEAAGIERPDPVDVETEE